MTPELPVELGLSYFVYCSNCSKRMVFVHPFWTCRHCLHTYVEGAFFEWIVWVPKPPPYVELKIE
jgi:hypothetical protein